MLKSDFLDMLFRKKSLELVSEDKRYNIQLDKCKKEGIEVIHLEDIISLIKKSGKYHTFIDSINNINEELLYNSELHGISHNERVALFAFALGLLENVNDSDLHILLEASKYHDIGRNDDSEDEQHGFSSAQMLDEVDINLSEEELEILKIICICHSIDDEKFQYMSTGVKDVERCQRLLNIFKDADALDRVRIRFNGLDASYLRTESARRMVPAAYELLYNYDCIIKEIEEEEKLEFPEGMFSYSSEVISMSSEQLEILKRQWKLFNRFRKYNINNNELTINEKGQVVFKEGTLIHGTSNFNEEKLKSISQTGIMPCEFLGFSEEGETFYCADFMRVPTEQTMDEYKEDNANSASGRIPFSAFSNSVAFVINPSEEIDEFLSMDAYSKENDNNISVRNFLNLDVSVPQRYLGERRGFASAIVGGIPASCISGIIIGRKVNKDQIDIIKKLFPDCYIIDADNVLIYNPNSQSQNSNNYEIQRENIRLQERNEDLERQLKLSREATINATRDRDRILEALRGKISDEELKEIYVGILGWQTRALVVRRSPKGRTS